MALTYLTNINLNLSVTNITKMKNEIFNHKTYPELFVFSAIMPSLSLPILMKPYKINNNFKIEIPYRYAIFEKKTKSRLALSTTINHKNKKNTFRYRIKAQRESELVKSEDFLRHKFLPFHQMHIESILSRSK